MTSNPNNDDSQGGLLGIAAPQIPRDVSPGSHRVKPVLVGRQPRGPPQPNGRLVHGHARSDIACIRLRGGGMLRPAARLSRADAKARLDSARAGGSLAALDPRLLQRRHHACRARLAGGQRLSQVARRSGSAGRDATGERDYRRCLQRCLNN